jgi:hypothetical protein
MDKVKYTEGPAEKPRLKRFEFQRADVSVVSDKILQNDERTIQRDETDEVYTIEHSAEDKTIVISMKVLNSKDPQLMHHVFYVLDTYRGVEVGFTELVRARGMTYSRNSETESGEEFRKKSLGTRRLAIANQFNVEKYGDPIYSGTTTTEQGKYPWEKLKELGFVEDTGNLDNYLYRFKKDAYE